MSKNDFFCCDCKKYVDRVIECAVCSFDVCTNDFILHKCHSFQTTQVSCSKQLIQNASTKPRCENQGSTQTNVSSVNQKMLVQNTPDEKPRSNICE